MTFYYKDGLFGEYSRCQFSNKLSDGGLIIYIDDFNYQN
tara:strand:- start:116 stop:232 length:117 start_codon:yes stop_codon:yes gene_type:complete